MRKFLFRSGYFTRANSAETPTVLKIWLGVSILFIFKTFKIMKTLELNQLEMLEGGGTPSGGQIYCYASTTILGFFNPVLGVIGGALCLFVD